MKKKFELGMPLESNTEYYATRQEYHVYPEDTVEVADRRYIALRAADTKEFRVFALIKGKKNITLDFCGAKLVMHGKIQPFLIDSSENITLKNCSVTYDRPPLTELLITEATPEYVRLRPNPNCPCRVEDGRLIPYSDSWENTRLNYKGCFYQVFDRETRMGCGIGLGVMGNSIELDPTFPYDPNRYTVKQEGDDFIMEGKIPDYFASHRALIIAHETRSLSSVFMIDSKNVTLDRYRILSGWGMGVYSYRTENITLDGLCMTYEEGVSPSLIANAADAVHTFGTSGSFVMRNCVLEGMIDDALNVHSNFRTVAQADGCEILTHLASCERQASDLYRVGDEIAVYRGKTMEESARYTLVAIEHLSETLAKFTVDRPCAPHEEGDLIESLTANCNITVENCTFGKANSHLRFQSRGKVEIRNCETELPFLLTGDASYWFESGPVTDLTVENCRFVGDRARIGINSQILPTAKEPYYHKNLKIVGNSFSTDSPLVGGEADGILFQGNENALSRPMTLHLTNCGTVEADNCTVIRQTADKTQLSLN